MLVAAAVAVVLGHQQSLWGKDSHKIPNNTVTVQAYSSVECDLMNKLSVTVYVWFGIL